MRVFKNSRFERFVLKENMYPYKLVTYKDLTPSVKAEPPRPAGTPPQEGN